MASLADYSSSLTARCQGAACYNDASANVYSFAGDVSDLYLMTSGSAPTFSKVSLTTGGYSVQAGAFWHFNQYGNYILATDYTDPIQVYTLGTSTHFSNLAVSANATATATIGGTATAGDTVSLTVTNPTVLSSPQTATYTVAASQTPTQIAAGLVALLNSNTQLQTALITATATGAVVTISQAGQVGNSTIISDLITGAAIATVTIGGTVTNGDTVSLLITNNAAIPAGTQTVSYTTSSGSTTSTVAAALGIAINNNATLSAAGYNATYSGNVLTVSQSGYYNNQTTYTSDITGSKTETVAIGTSSSGKSETVTLNPATGIMAGGVDNAPHAAYMAIIRNFLVVGNTYDPVGGMRPQRIWWSGIGDPTSWPTPDTQQAYNVQSDFQDIYGDYGAITGIVSDLGTADGAVFFQRAVIRLVYLGPPAIFSVLPAENVRGTSAPGSIVQLGALVYYHADDGFFVFDGTNSKPIGFQKVDQYFKNTVDPNYVNQMIGGADPLTGIIYWSFTTLGSGTINNQTIVYSTKLDRWSVGGFGIEYFTRGLSFGYTIEQLNQFGTIEQITQPFDSSVWAGGKLQLQGFDPANHQLGYFNGNNLAATIDTAEIEPFEGMKGYVTNCRPIVDGGVPAIALAARFRAEDVPVYNTAVSMNAIGQCPQRISGQFFRARLTVPAAATWSHAMGVETAATMMGAR